MAGKNNTGIPTERFRANFEIDPASNLNEREFIGLASVFGSLVENYPPTIIEKGAFTKTLLDRKDKIPILWQHDTHEPIGVPVELEETNVGLRIRGKLSKTDTGDKALELMRDGALKGISVGFDPVRWTMAKEKDTDEEWDAVRHIEELKLWEVSLVTFGADPHALVSETSTYKRTPNQLEGLRTAVKTIQEMLDTAEPPTQALTVDEQNQQNQTVTTVEPSAPEKDAQALDAKQRRQEESELELLELDQAAREAGLSVGEDVR